MRSKYSVKLKKITPVVLDEIMKQLLKKGNLNQSCILKKKSVFQNVCRKEFCETAGIGKSCLYAALKGKAIRKENAEKIAAGVNIGRMVSASAILTCMRSLTMLQKAAD